MGGLNGLARTSSASPVPSRVPRTPSATSVRSTTGSIERPTRARSWATSVAPSPSGSFARSEEHTSELQSQSNLVCRLLLEKKKKKKNKYGDHETRYAHVR